MAGVEEDVDQDNSCHNSHNSRNNQCNSNRCSRPHSKVLTKETLEPGLEEGEGVADHAQDAPGLTMTTLVNSQMRGKVAMITGRETLDKVVTTTDIKVETDNKAEGLRGVMVADVLKVVLVGHKEVLASH